MGNVSRCVFAAIMLFALVHAEITLTAMDVVINANNDGSADVTEDLHLLITTDYHMSMYTNGLTKNDLASWSALTGLSDVRYHMDTRYVDVQDVVVRPQPLSTCNPLADLCHGELMITYHLEPYFDAQGNPINETGLFIADDYKPRTTEYSFNSGALGFQESELGDVILGENQRLSIIFPESARSIEVSPLPEGVSEGEMRASREASWENTVLAHLRISFEKEEGLDEEVLGFFVDARQWMTELFSGPEGISLVILLAILIGGYLHLQSKVKRVAK